MLSVKNKGHDYHGRSSGRNTLGLWVRHLLGLCSKNTTDIDWTGISS